MYKAANQTRVQAANEMTETTRERSLIRLDVYFNRLVILVLFGGLTVARPLRGLPPDAVPGCKGGKDFSYSQILSKNV